jgi:DNA mismatch endonuclease (patch repair protein)
MDKIDRKIRSRNMAHIKSKNTSPELLVRRKLFSLGYRYRIHYKLPGKPDIVFPRNKIAIFINGCFWHGHNCKVDHKPKSNINYWEKKIANNRVRDAINICKIKTMKWKILTIWECQIQNNFRSYTKKIVKYLV